MLLILRLKAVIRRVGRFFKIYYWNIYYKYFSKSLKKTETNSPLEITKINCFSTICEYLDNKDLGNVMLSSKLINKRIEKIVIWENLFINKYLKMANDYKRLIEINRFITLIANIKGKYFDEKRIITQ